MLNCFGIAGWKNSGKTTLVAALVSNLSKQGLAVSTIKHAHHTFDLDQPGTDSFKHREAGAQEVVLVSKNRWAVQHELRNKEEPTLADITAKISHYDILLVEGYKREPIPKIEIIGPNTVHTDYLWTNDKNIKAIACDQPLPDCPLPRFDRNSIEQISQFILQTLGKEV